MHLKHALYLEDEEKFEEAKDEFIQAGKPREAIDMFIHQQDWVSATRVAEIYEPAALPDVSVAQEAAEARRFWKTTRKVFRNVCITGAAGVILCDATDLFDCKQVWLKPLLGLH